MEHFSQILLLLALTTFVVICFQRMHVPTSLGYLLVGIVLGPYTIGPTVSIPEFEHLAEYGIVFLLFTIGLSFSLPHLQTLRGQVLSVGIGQVLFSTLFVFVLYKIAGFSTSEAFIFGAVFAQSSTTIISRLLSELNEENTQHGRIGLATSVFQDITAVPFLIIIPLLVTPQSTNDLFEVIVVSLVKASIAFGLVFFIGRRLFKPLFNAASKSHSVEIFTLAVLSVVLISAWITSNLGLSLSLGAFMAGMMLGETEFRHQVESSVRPFRDVLLGLFFVGIGMKFDLSSIFHNWLWILGGATIMILSKFIIVATLVYKSGISFAIALRTGIILSVGGEFGFALVAIGLDAKAITEHLGQIAISSVLLSMIIGAVLIKYNKQLSETIRRIGGIISSEDATSLTTLQYQTVVLGGYGRVGKTISQLLVECKIPLMIFDTDFNKVMQGRELGLPVFYGDISNPDLLSAISIEKASLVVITINNCSTAMSIVNYLSRHCPQVPVVARAIDTESSKLLTKAGAIYAHPETIEASLNLGTFVLKSLQVEQEAIDTIIGNIRDNLSNKIIVNEGDL